LLIQYMIFPDLKVMVPSQLPHRHDPMKKIKWSKGIFVPGVHVYQESEFGKTPDEILDFLRAKGGHSLLIKGKAGTGKTTLALQIIEELSDEQVDY
jgi:Cdc6-like AAA superfamily ATPase